MGNRESEIPCSQFQSALIVGKKKNDDTVSNATGKTTIIRAIEYVLFNETYQVNLDEIVRHGKQKAIVELDFEIDGLVYRVYRHRTSKGTPELRLYQRVNDKWESISERTPSETEVKLRKIIKITYHSFENSVLFRQDQITGLSAVDPKARRELLKEPMDLSVYTKLEDLTKKRATPIRKKISQLETSVGMLGNPSADIDKAEISLKECLAKIEKANQSVATKQVSIQDHRLTLDRLKDLLSKSDVDIEKKAIDQKNIYNELAKKLKTAQSSVQKAKSDLERREQEYTKFNENIAKQYKNLQDLRNQADKFTNTPAELRNQLNKVEEEEKSSENVISRTELELEQLSESIPEDDKCPTCKQDISHDYRQEFEKNTKIKIEIKKTALIETKALLKDFQNKKINLRKEFDELADLNQKISLITKQLGNEEESQTRLEESVRDVKALLIERETDFGVLNKECQMAQERLDELEKAMGQSKVSDLKKKIDDVNIEITKCENSISEIQNNIANLRSNEGILLERIRARSEDKIKLEELTKELEGQQRELRLHQKVADAFSHKGIPTFIIHTILNELQFETNKALKELRPDLEIQLDADLNITYKHNGDEMNYGLLSHGQHVYIALSFKRGLSRIIQKRLGVNLNILIFDEVDSPMDKAGLEAYSDAIQKWSKETSIFVVTHNDALKEKFTYAILVEQGDDGSEAKLVTSW